MARLLQQFTESPRRCNYLPDRLATVEYKVMVGVSPEELEKMLERGWRRFGPVYFRPACSPCGECISLRIPVDAFVPSRSQRRAEKSCAALRADIGPVRVDPERLALYAAWHAGRELARSWEPSPIDEDTYAQQFAFAHPSAREIAYYDDHPPGGDLPRLVGVGLCDETPHAWSAIYFFYDPAYARWSPGVSHVMRLLRAAHLEGKAHVYLGFRVNDCVSMRYKALFQPHELLRGRPDMNEAPVWEVQRLREERASSR